MIGKKNIFDPYELYVTLYKFVPVLHNNQHHAAHIFQKNDILQYGTVDARSETTDEGVQRQGRKRACISST
jgi:hypothetical protein